MRGRVTLRRTVSYSSPLGRRWFIDYKGNKPKALERHQDEEGNIFYTVSKRNEGRGMASPLSGDAQTSFLISNLLLDLDGYEVAGVRPYGSQEEERLTKHYRTTGRWGEVEGHIQELVKTLNQSRWNADKLVLHPAHPKRITDSDIISAALRPPTTMGVVYSPSKGIDASATYKSGPRKEETQERYDIRALNHAHPQPDRSALARSAIPKTVSGRESSSGHELRRTIDFGDSTLRQSDFMEQVRQTNGVPEHATQDDVQLIRWMLLRQHNSAFIADKTPAPSTKDVVAAIRNVQKQEGTRANGTENIASIRRITFHALNTGSSLFNSESEGETEDNVAVQLQESIRAVLEANHKKKHLYFETLTFANNLSSRLNPQRHEELALTILSLRLQATAGLGHVKLMATYLDQGVDAGAMQSDVAVLKDTKAALASLDVNFRQMKELQSVENREILFRVLTGYGKAGSAQGGSMRKLILQGETRQNADLQERRLSVFISYIKLVGRIGGFHSLWSEWRIAQGMVKGNKKRPKETRDAAHRLITSGFKSAIKYGQKQGKLSSASGDGNFGESAASDCEKISQGTEASTSSRQAWGQMTSEEFEEMMNLPFSEWLDKVRATCT